MAGTGQRTVPGLSAKSPPAFSEAALAGPLEVYITTRPQERLHTGAHHAVIDDAPKGNITQMVPN